MALSRFDSSNSSSTMRAQRAAIAEESLERARQSTVAVGEVRAQGLLEGGGGPFVDLLRLADHPLELRAHGVHVDRDADVLERDAGRSAGRVRRATARSAAGRSPRNAARVGSARVRRSTTMRSPSRRTAEWSGMTAASMPATLGPTRDI